MVTIEKETLAYKIFMVRYPRKDNLFLEEYLEKFGSSKEDLLTLLKLLKDQLENPISWRNYTISDMLKANTNFFKKELFKRINNLIVQDDINPNTIRSFFLTNHEIIKYALQRWILVNAGIAIELFTISEEKVERNFLAALFKKRIKLGDEVIHLHVVSNSERKDLQAMSFNVPFAHWDKSYYTGALNSINNLLQSNVESIGLFCEDSWVFDPAIHEIASDGKPYASFSFLKDDRLTGERFFVGEAKSDNNYFKQYEFSLKSPRRKAFYNKGEFIPKTYGIFYPKEKLKNALLELSLI
ncbi:MAG TPA: hypothetical protein VLF89_05520 [Candidatus Saccharimonadales bacterium]|nr:hypothetical protein [Candidatus Saccharimonadales bacterium]